MSNLRQRIKLKNVTVRVIFNARYNENASFSSSISITFSTVGMLSLYYAYHFIS